MTWLRAASRTEEGRGRSRDFRDSYLFVDYSDT